MSHLLQAHLDQMNRATNLSIETATDKELKYKLVAIKGQPIGEFKAKSKTVLRFSQYYRDKIRDELGKRGKTTDYRVWPDSEYESVEEEPDPCSWKSDDYFTLQIPDFLFTEEFCVDTYIAKFIKSEV